MRRGLLIASFIESLAVVLLERGIYFYTEAVYDYGRASNLWLGLAFGVCYVSGALSSHRISGWLGERRSLLAAVVGQGAVLFALVAMPTPVVIWIGFCVIGLLSGFMWPIVESYITAGLLARQMLRSVGRFCIAWSLAVPIGVAITGPLIASGWAGSFFLAAALCHVVSLGLFVRLPARPAHAAPDDPEQPDPQRLRRYTALMIGSRWSMLASYALLFLLAPLLPHITKQTLGLPTQWATVAASVMDWVRVATFAAMSVLTFWYGRVAPLLVAILLLPVGFGMVLFGQTLGVVLAGEVIFGLVGGLVYYAALYYALAVKNAAVEAGGVHEALIGGGFALGPLCGLIGLGFTNLTGSYVEGMLLGAAPLAALCAFGGAWPLVRLMRPARR